MAAESAVTLVTGFTTITTTVSPVGEELLRRMGQTAEKVTDVRRAEDCRAARVLGVSRTDLRLLDAISRYPTRYAVRDALAGGSATVAADDPGREPLRAELRRFVAEQDLEVLLVADASGGHVDHQLCLSESVLLSERGLEVWMYPEFPYRHWLPPGQSQRARTSQTVWADITEWVEAHVEAAHAYASQVRAFFESPEHFENLLRSGLRRDGTDRYGVQLHRVGIPPLAQGAD